MTQQIQNSSELAELSQSPVVAYLSTLAPSSTRVAQSHLDSIAAFAGFNDAMSAPWETLTYTHTQAIRQKLTEKYPPKTANVKLSALRGVLKAAWRMGKMDTDQYMRAIDLAPVRGSRVEKGRAATQEEMKAIFDVCCAGKELIGVRDAAIFAVLFGAGLRRDELVKLTVDDYHPASGELRVLGKGNKERVVYATNGGKLALDAWIRAREAYKTTSSNHLFLQIDRWGNVGDGLSGNSIYNMVIKRCEEAGVEPLSPHDTRRTYITGLLDAGVDIKTVADMVGHSKIETTGHYDRRGERAKMDAADMVHVPY